MSDIRMEGMEIKDRRGKTIGTLRNNFLRDAKERKVGFVQGNSILDAGGNKLGSVEGMFVCDASGKRIAGLDEIRRSVPGTPGGVSMAAVWLIFAPKVKVVDYHGGHEEDPHD